MVLGASFDAPADNQAFRDKHGFPFPLLSDTERKLALAYGACDDAGASHARRAAVVIDGKGRIVRWYAKVDARAFPAEVLGDLPAPAK